MLDLADGTRPFRVILADHSPSVGSNMGDSARPVIEEALAGLGVETRLGSHVVSINLAGVMLSSGEEIATATVVWCAGMRANPSNRTFPAEPDRVGRIPVDDSCGSRQYPTSSRQAMWLTLLDDTHVSVMSCRHARPMGRIAGHNVVSDLLNLPMLPLQINWYTTILDLGAWGALYTEGWDRHLVAKGESAKQTKRLINHHRIYPH